MPENDTDQAGIPVFAVSRLPEAPIACCLTSRGRRKLSPAERGTEMAGSHGDRWRNMRRLAATALGAAFPRPVLWQVAVCLAVLAAVDLGVALLCPRHGGNCLYGLFTLVAGPVLLAGLCGSRLPRAAARLADGHAARAALIAAGGLAVLGLTAAGHVAAIRLANGADYGGILVRPRLLWVGLALAGVYYGALAAIAMWSSPRGR